MNIYDFSPKHENKTGLPGRIAIYANRQQQFERAVMYFEKYFSANFPNGMKMDLGKARKLLPKNSKVIISCFWNDITGKYELLVTNKTIIRNNWYFWKYDFVGNLTDFANRG